MNAITFLIKEHNKFRKDLTTILKKVSRAETKKKMFSILSANLLRHEAMEHKVWYPHFKNNKKLKSEVRHLLSEEKHAEKAIKKLKSLKDEEAWQTNFVKFKKEVESHAKEEEKDLFPNVEEILDEDELQKIGKDMRRFKTAYNKKKKLT